MGGYHVGLLMVVNRVQLKACISNENHLRFVLKKIVDILFKQVNNRQVVFNTFVLLVDGDIRLVDNQLTSLDLVLVIERNRLRLNQIFKLNLLYELI